MFVGLFVEVGDGVGLAILLYGWGDGRGGRLVALELDEVALELGDGVVATLGRFAQFRDGFVAGEGFLGGDGDFEVAKFGEGGDDARALAVGESKSL